MDVLPRKRGRSALRKRPFRIAKEAVSHCKTAHIANQLTIRGLVIMTNMVRGMVMEIYKTRRQAMVRACLRDDCNASIRHR